MNHDKHLMNHETHELYEKRTGAFRSTAFVCFVPFVVTPL